METIQIYKSQDGEFFSDPGLCAKHEFIHIKGLLEKFNQLIEKAYPSEFVNWCESGACACMGCANREVLEAGFNKYHWQFWFDTLLPGEVSKLRNSSWEKTIKIEHLPENKIPVMSFLRQLLPHKSLNDISHIVNSEEKIIGSFSYNEARDIKNKLASLGANVVEENVLIKPLTVFKFSHNNSKIKF